MRRQYNICRKDIKQLIKDLQKYAPEMTYDIDLLSIINDKLKNNFNFQEDDCDVLCDLREQSFYLPFFEESYKHFKLFCSRGMYVDGSKYNIKYNKINISEQDAIDISEDFFHECGPFFSKPFHLFKDKAKHHLKFISPARQSEGEIYYLPGIDDFYLFVPRYNNLSRASILIHEIEHYIDLCIRYDFHRQHLIRECSAIFMEMIGCDWIADKLKLSKDGIKRRFQIHSNVKSDYRYLYFKNQALHIIERNYNMSDEDLIKRLDEYGFSEFDLALFSRESLVQDYYYQISYLIATELYVLYQIDKERALYILKHIIINGTDQNIFEILKQFGIQLNRNIHAYEKDMVLSLIRKKED